MTFSNFFSDYLGNLEWLDVIIGAVLLLVIGWVWYGPLFGNRGGMSDGGIPEPMAIAKGFVQFFLFGLGLNLVMPALHVYSGNESLSFETLLVTSFVISFLLVAMVQYGRVIWSDGQMDRWLIDFGFWFVGSFAYGLVVLDLLA